MLGVSLEEYHRMVESAASSRILSYEQLAKTPNGRRCCPRRRRTVPRRCSRKISSARRWRQAIAALPERERLVLSLYYDEELNLREIGEVLDVSESRVCQIHGQAVLRMRARLDEWFSDE